MTPGAVRCAAPLLGVAGELDKMIRSSVIRLCGEGPNRSDAKQGTERASRHNSDTDSHPKEEWALESLDSIPKLSDRQFPANGDVPVSPARAAAYADLAVRIHHGPVNLEEEFAAIDSIP